MNDSTFIFVSGGKKSRFFKSTDKGKSWKITSLPYLTSETSGAFSICMISEKIGVIVGGDYSNPDLCLNTCFYTDDGGEYTGSVEYTGGGMDSDQKKNMGLILKALESAGVTDPKSQIGILSVIKKESNFKLGDEIGYCSTSDSRIESIFGARGKKCKSMKCNDKEFFDCLYGYKSGVNLGNTEPGDGYKYLGRGFHGLTGKANYKKYGISDPESLNDDPKVAAKEVADFFKPHVKDFDSVEDAVTEMNRINSGGSQFGLSKALEASSGFNVK